MKVATTIADLREFTSSFADSVRLFQGTGFQYLDFSFYTEIYPGSPFLGKNWLENVLAAAQAAKDFGFSFVQAHSPGYDPFSKTADHEIGMLATLRSIEACGLLGIPNLVVHPGCSEDYLYPQDKNAFFRANQAYYEKLYPAMEKYNVNVLIENGGLANAGEKYIFMTGQEMADFLELCNHPLLHACWDTGHANMDGRDQYKNIIDLGDHLRAIHFNDNMGSCDEHIAPFCGTMDIDAVIQGLIDIGYKGYLTFEGTVLRTGDHWPRYRRKESQVAEHKLHDPPLELWRKAEALLYEIGKSILCTYNCFEV